MATRKKRSVLVLAGHLDDSIIAVGGILRRFVLAGDRVHVFCFGNGDEAFTTLAARAGAVEKFTAEAVKAHRLLGVSFECAGLPDFGVERNRETYRACIGAIRAHRPDIILGHYWAEYFQHRDMARLACDAWWQAGWDCSADLGRPWRARSLLHYEVIHDLPEPTHLVDVSDTFADKLAAWRVFDSADDHLSGMAAQLEARARHHGSKIGVRYAEALRRSSFIPRAVTDIRELR